MVHFPIFFFLPLKCDFYFYFYNFVRNKYMAISYHICIVQLSIIIYSFLLVQTHILDMSFMREWRGHFFQNESSWLPLDNMFSLSKIQIK